jgi:hypothetical protein
MFVVRPAGTVVAGQVTVDQVGFGDGRKDRNPRIVPEGCGTRLLQRSCALERGRRTEPRVNQKAVENRCDGVHLVHIGAQEHRGLRLTHRKNGFRRETLDGTVTHQTADLRVDVVGELVAGVM